MSQTQPSAFVSMSDIARQAGVHPSTVSRALRNDQRLPVETRERVRKLAEKSGYRPNPLVSALIVGRRRRGLHGAKQGGGGVDQPGSVLAFLTAWEKRGQWRNARQYAAVFAAMKRHAWKRGYALEEFWLGGDGMTARRLGEILTARGIRGVVVCPLPGGMCELEFDFSGFSSVALGYTLQAPALDHVAYDYCTVLKMSVQHLRRHGFSRIGFITTSKTSNRVAHLSLGAFLAERHLELRRFLPPLVTSGFPEEVAVWIREKRPDVIITPTQAECDAVRGVLGQIPVVGSLSTSLVCLDCHDNSVDAGMVRDTEAEAYAAIELLAGRVERGLVGIVESPQTILVGGRWREGDFPCFT